MLHVVQGATSIIEGDTKCDEDQEVVCKTVEDTDPQRHTYVFLTHTRNNVGYI